MFYTLKIDSLENRDLMILKNYENCPRLLIRQWKRRRKTFKKGNSLPLIQMDKRNTVKNKKNVYCERKTKNLVIFLHNFYSIGF